MRTMMIELRKEKRNGVIPVMLGVGILGGGYAFANFIVHKDSLLGLPLPPTDVLLTQIYGMLMILNMFGIIVAASVTYHMEFKGSAIKKMYMLPVSVSKMYLCKFSILTFMLLFAAAMQNSALAKIGVTGLPKGIFELDTLIIFAGYSFVTAMPVLSFMTLISSRFENIWIPIGVGVLGFLSAMALASSEVSFLLAHPFILMMKPAVAMSAKPDMTVALISLIETTLFLFAGLWMSKNLSYE